MTLREFAVQHDASAEFVEWLGERDLHAMWEECKHPNRMLWMLGALGYDDHATARLFGCQCARRVLHQMTDGRSRAAVDVAERYTRGEATGDELAAAHEGAAAAESVQRARSIDAAERCSTTRAEANAHAPSDAASAAESVSDGRAGLFAAGWAALWASDAASGPNAAGITWEAVTAAADAESAAQADILREMIQLPVVQELWERATAGAA